MASTSSCEAAATAALQLLLEFQQVQSQRAGLYTRFNAGFRDFLEHGQERAYALLMQQTTPAFAAVSKQVIHIEACLRSAAVGRADLALLLRQVQELERNKLQLTLSWQALRAAHAAGRFSWQSQADRPSLGSTQASNIHQHTQQQQQQQLMGMLERLQVQSASSSAQPLPGAGMAVVPDVSGGHDQLPLASATDPQQEGFMTVKPGFYQQQLQQAVAAAQAADAAGSLSSSRDHHHGHATGSSSSSSSSAGCCSHHHHHHHSHDRDNCELPDPLESNPLEPTEAEYNAAVREALQELDRCMNGINEVLEEVRDAVLELQEHAPGAGE